MHKCIKGFKMNKKKLISNLISVVLMLAFGFVYIYTYHQLQASYGIGLYYAIKMNHSDNRLYFDLAADLVRFLLLAGLILVPSILTRKFAPVYLLRRMSLLIAVAPTISIGCFINFFKDMRFGIEPDLFQALLSYANIFKFILPMLIIFLLAAYKSDSGFSIKRYLPLLIIALVSLFLSLTLNKCFEPGVYLTFYMFVLTITDLVENKLCDKAYFDKFDILYFFLYISALYRLVDIAIHTNF